MVKKEVPKPKKKQNGQNGPKPPANDFSRAKETVDFGNSERIIWARDGKPVKPVGFEDRLTNKLLLLGEYSNLEIYEDRETIEKGMSAENWPKSLKEALALEHEKLDETVRSIIRKPSLKKTSVLDCGCGTGRYLPWETDMFENVVGIDFSGTMLKIAGDHIAYERGGIGADKTRLILGDMTDMPGISSDSLNLAICPFNTLGTVEPEKQAEIIAQVNRVLKAPSRNSASFFFFTLYLDNKKTQEMQREFYTNMGLTVLDTDHVENGRHYTISQHPAGFKLKSQRSTLEDFKRILGNKFGILELKQINEIMACVVAVPSKRIMQRGEELIEAIKQYRRQEISVLLAGGILTDMADAAGNTPLITASKVGDFRIIKQIIDAGLEVNAVNKDGETALTIACKNGNINAVAALMEAGADVNTKNRDGDTPLILACEDGNKNIAARLVIAGAEMEHENNKGETALSKAAGGGHTGTVRLLSHFSPYNSLVKAPKQKNLFLEDGGREHMRCGEWTSSIALIAAAKNGYERIVDELLRLHPDINISDEDHNTALMLAIKNGHDEIAKKLLKKKPKLKKGNKDGDTVLTLASLYGRNKLVKIILESKKKVDDKTYHGRTPLTLASMIGNKGIMKMLIEKGAKIDHQDNTGMTPLMGTMFSGKEAAKILLEAGADMELRDEYGNTALLRAVMGNDLNVARFLIEAGADINAINEKGESALHLIAKNENKDAPEIAKMLMKRGIKMSEDENSIQWSPLFFAQAYHLPEMVRVLVEGGYVGGSKVEDSLSPFASMVLKGQFDLAEKMLEKGADINQHSLMFGTPLILAVEQKNEKAVKWLIKKGASLDELDRGPMGENALFKAVKNQDITMIKILLKAGASPNPKTNTNILLTAIRGRNRKIVHMLKNAGASLDNKHPVFGVPLITAIILGKDEDAIELIEAGASLEIGTVGSNSALSSAIKHGKLELVRLMVKKGADVTFRSANWGSSPLTSAAEAGNVEIAKVLISANAPIEGIPEERKTPLIKAVEEGHVEMVKLLLRFGANVHDKRILHTPLEIAVNEGHTKIEKILREHGAVE